MKQKVDFYSESDMNELSERQRDFADFFAEMLVKRGWKVARPEVKKYYSDKQFYRLMKDDRFNRYLHQKIREYMTLFRH